MTSSKPDKKNQPAGAGARCPICDHAAAAKYDPFCSKRCADVDLHRWLSGRYAIPATEDESDSGGGSDD